MSRRALGHASRGTFLRVSRGACISVSARGGLKGRQVLKALLRVPRGAFVRVSRGAFIRVSRGACISVCDGTSQSRCRDDCKLVHAACHCLRLQDLRAEIARVLFRAAAYHDEISFTHCLLMPQVTRLQMSHSTAPDSVYLALHLSRYRLSS